MFSFQDVTALEFEKLAEPHEAQFVEETAEDEEANYEDIGCVPEEGGSVIDLDYKTRAADYWKSDGKSVNRGGTHTDRLRFITEYVLTNFENSILDGKIIHDMDLRQRALETKQEIGHLVALQEGT
ncbi:hypothetical protein Trydic_g4562 [Trypoxylus dichotomus]